MSFLTNKMFNFGHLRTADRTGTNRIPLRIRIGMRVMHRSSGPFISLLKEKLQGFLGLNVAGDPIQDSILFEARTGNGYRFPLLLGYPLHFPIDLVAGCIDSFELG